MKRPTLTAPFAHTTQLRGQTIIPPSEVIDRLNAVLGVGNWDYKVNAHRDPLDPDFIVAKGRLIIKAGNEAGIPPCVYEQYGGDEISRYGKDHSTRPGQIIDLGDSYKGAASNAMKKCAQHPGLGLYLALQHAPMSAAKFDEEKGGPNTGQENENDTGTAVGGDGNGSSQPALTPGFSGEEF